MSPASRASAPPGPPTVAPTDGARTALVSPPARRPELATWRDPRLVIGILIVVVSVLLGAKLLGGSDDTVPVWVAASDLREGAALAPSDLQQREVSFANAADADRYLSGGEALPEGTTLVRDVGAGELLPRAAVGGGASPAFIEVPLALAAEAVPATVQAGSVVDVWVTPVQGAAGEEAEAVQVFDDVMVVAAPRSGGALGPSMTRQVIVGLDPEQETNLPEALALAATGTSVITKQG